MNPGCCEKQSSKIPKTVRETSILFPNPIQPRNNLLNYTPLSFILITISLKITHFLHFLLQNSFSPRVPSLEGKGGAIPPYISPTSIFLLPHKYFPAPKSLYSTYTFLLTWGFHQGRPTKRPPCEFPSTTNNFCSPHAFQHQFSIQSTSCWPQPVLLKNSISIPSPFSRLRGIPRSRKGSEASR